MQRFASYEDLTKQHVTIEEREEYEQHIKMGTVVYAGVDYEAILREVRCSHSAYIRRPQRFMSDDI